jgi:3-dehydroquinate synthetase
MGLRLPQVHECQLCAPINPAAAFQRRATTAVVDFVVVGATNAAIAMKLIISPATVKTHITHVLTKLGVANRALKRRSVCVLMTGWVVVDLAGVTGSIRQRGPPPLSRKPTTSSAADRSSSPSLALID